MRARPLAGRPGGRGEGRTHNVYVRVAAIIDNYGGP